MFSDKPFMHGIVAVVVGVALSLASIVVVGLKKHVFFFFFSKNNYNEDFILA